MISFLLGELVNRRHCAAAAITLVCAMGLLTVPVQAMAAPTPDSSPSPSASASAPDVPSPAAPSSEKDLEKIREQIETLYRQAGAATDAYNLAEEQTKKQSGEIVKLAKAIVDGQARIAELKDRAGAQAREQYRNGGLPPGAQLVLSDDPQLFLDGVNKVRTSQQASKTVLAELTRTQEDLETYTQDASSNWHKLETNRVKQAEAKKKINAQIAAAEKLESRLEKKELARLRQLEQDAANRAQSAWLATRPTPNIAVSGATTAAGKAAVAFATAQIGKPYVWGATGPGSYDCSGLTSKAWAAAGRPIPRTSQEQWRLLPRIDIQDMRPGDLIIYHADASHVGMYVGDGAIVHSPRPGRHVTLAGAGSMKILGVVRPDR
ncbi:Putative endopeptidase [Streptomyces sp. KY75]|nr:putative endopeptidase [Streptomyces sp. IB2014 011-1]CAD5965399.1 Putative endopeptidase [Streptomyces sp. KY70]CAD5977966.1 Putative endopeptidase [Streptomyces sp. KY75]